MKSCLSPPHQSLAFPLDVRIKWPNDLYTSTGLKIGGVLIHTTWATDRFNVVTGVGLNLSNRQPTTCIEAMVEEAMGIMEGKGSGQGESFMVGARAGAGELSSTSAPDASSRIGRELLLASIINRLEQHFKV